MPGDDELAERLRQRIATRLDQLSLTPITAATRAGLPRDTIRSVFRQGGSLPRVDTLANIAGALDTSVAYLIGETNFPTDPHDDERFLAAARAIQSAKPIPVVGTTGKLEEFTYPEDAEEILYLNVPGFEDIELHALSIGDDSMDVELEDGEFIIFAPQKSAGLRNQDLVVVTREVDGQYEWNVRQLALSRGTGGSTNGGLFAVNTRDDDDDAYPDVPFREPPPGWEKWQMVGIVVARLAFYLRPAGESMFPAFEPPTRPPKVKKPPGQG